MRSLLLVSLVVLSFIGAPKTIYAQSETTPKTIECADIQKYKISQVIYDGALAKACDSDYSDTCYGLTVFMPTKKDEDFYDDKIITAPKGQCIAYKGVYKYETRSGLNKTVPILIFIQK